jgi:hypothetical protein
VPTAAKNVLWRTVDLAAQLVLGLAKRFPLWTAILVLGTVGYLFRDHMSGNVTALKVGDCFDVPAGVVTDTVLKDVQHHPCSETHGAELLFTGFAPGPDNAFPADADLNAFAQTLCVPAYLAYTGRDFMTDEAYDVKTLFPTGDGWKQGDRGFSCLIVRTDGLPMTATVRVRP